MVTFFPSIFDIWKKREAAAPPKSPSTENQQGDDFHDAVEFVDLQITKIGPSGTVISGTSRRTVAIPVGSNMNNKNSNIMSAIHNADSTASVTAGIPQQQQQQQNQSEPIAFHYRKACKVYEYHRPSNSNDWTHVSENFEHCLECHCSLCNKPVADCKNWARHCNRQHKHKKQTECRKRSLSERMEEEQQAQKIDTPIVRNVSTETTDTTTVENQVSGQKKSLIDLSRIIEEEERPRDADLEDECRSIGQDSEEQAANGPPSPHYRQYCPSKSFQAEPHVANKLHCDQCYCYICDTTVNNCYCWEESHCNAIETGKWGPMWLERRKLHRKEQFQAKAKTNFSTKKASASKQKMTNASTSTSSRSHRSTEQTVPVGRKKIFVSKTARSSMEPRNNDRHYRYCCPVHSFNSHKTVPSNKPFCKKCYCYVCDAPVSKCFAWDDSHCHATNKGTWAKLWKDRRNLHRKEAEQLKYQRLLAEAQDSQRRMNYNKPTKRMRK